MSCYWEILAAYFIGAGTVLLHIYWPGKWTLREWLKNRKKNATS